MLRSNQSLWIIHICFGPIYRYIKAWGDSGSSLHRSTKNIIIDNSCRPMRLVSYGPITSPMYYTVVSVNKILLSLPSTYYSIRWSNVFYLETALVPISILIRIDYCLLYRRITLTPHGDYLSLYSIVFCTNFVCILSGYTIIIFIRKRI